MRMINDSGHPLLFVAVESIDGVHTTQNNSGKLPSNPFPVQKKTSVSVASFRRAPFIIIPSTNLFEWCFALEEEDKER